VLSFLSDSRSTVWRNLIPSPTCPSWPGCIVKPNILSETFNSQGSTALEFLLGHTCLFVALKQFAHSIILGCTVKWKKFVDIVILAQSGKEK